MKVRDVIKMIEKDGWYLARTRGKSSPVQASREAWFGHSAWKAGRRSGSGHPQQHHETGWFEAMKYLIIIEPTATGFSAYSPDVPGCVSTGATREEVERNMQEAIAFHIEGLQLEGMPVPEPSSESMYVEIAA